MHIISFPKSYILRLVCTYGIRTFVGYLVFSLFKTTMLFGLVICRGGSGSGFLLKLSGSVTLLKGTVAQAFSSVVFSWIELNSPLAIDSPCKIFPILIVIFLKSVNFPGAV